MARILRSAACTQPRSPLRDRRCCVLLMCGVSRSYGICLWTGLSKSPQPWMAYLRYPDGPVTALAWSPCGLKLASASEASDGIVVWDVSTESPTRLVRLGATKHLSWSPSGMHLFQSTTYVRVCVRMQCSQFDRRQLTREFEWQHLQDSHLGDQDVVVREVDGAEQLSRTPMARSRWRSTCSLHR